MSTEISRRNLLCSVAATLLVLHAPSNLNWEEDPSKGVNWEEVLNKVIGDRNAWVMGFDDGIGSYEIGSLRLLIPLRKVDQQFETIDKFLSELTDFALRKSDALLKSLEKGAEIGGAINEIIRFNIPVVPGVIAVNLNSTVKHMRRWWDTKST